MKPRWYGWVSYSASLTNLTKTFKTGDLGAKKFSSNFLRGWEDNIFAKIFSSQKLFAKSLGKKI
jgi:hypothetical protein